MAGHQTKSKHICLCFKASSQSCLKLPPFSLITFQIQLHCTFCSALSIKSCHHTSLSKQKSKLLSADMHTATHLAKMTFSASP